MLMRIDWILNIFAFFTYCMITYAFEAVGINAGKWKYKNWKIAAGSMVWLAGTFMAMLMMCSIAYAIWGTIGYIISYPIMSVIYGTIGVACDEKMDVWEKLEIGKDDNWALYFARTIFAGITAEIFSLIVLVV